MNRGHIFAQCDITSKANELGDMGKSILVDRVGHTAAAIGAAEQRYPLRLQIGRKSGVDGGGHIDRSKPRRGGKRHLVPSDIELAAGFLQLLKNNRQVVGIDLSESHLPPRHRRSDHQCAGFDPVRDGLLVDRAQIVDTLYGDHRGSEPLDLRSHLLQEPAGGGDFGLHRGIGDRRLSIG